MQGGDPSGEPDADRPPLLQAHRRAACKARLQKLALIERHDGVEAGLPPGRQLEDLRHPRTVHMRPDPRLAHERRMMGCDRGDLRLRELKRRLAALDFVHGAENAAVPPVGDERFERKAVDRLADRPASGSAAIA